MEWMLRPTRATSDVSENFVYDAMEEYTLRLVMCQIFPCECSILLVAGLSGRICTRESESLSTSALMLTFSVHIKARVTTIQSAGQSSTNETDTYDGINLGDLKAPRM